MEPIFSLGTSVSPRSLCRLHTLSPHTPHRCKAGPMGHCRSHHIALLALPALLINSGQEVKLAVGQPTMLIFPSPGPACRPSPRADSDLARLSRAWFMSSTQPTWPGWWALPAGRDVQDRCHISAGGQSFPGLLRSPSPQPQTLMQKSFFWRQSPCHLLAYGS